MTEKVQAVLILEILGRPAEYIKKTLSEIVDKLKEEKDVSVINKKIAEPKPVEGQENLFTSFAEIELETFLEKLMAICFAYMPSHIEIVKPEELKISNAGLNSFLNELISRLHKYDELVKALMIERQTLAKAIKDGEVKTQKRKKKKN